MGSQRLDQLAEAGPLDGSEDLYVLQGGNDRRIPSDTFRRAIGADLTLSVGSGEDYATINAAIENFSRRFPAYTQGGHTVELHLATGFTMAEQVFARGLDLSWLTITAADASVPVDRSALTESDPVFSVQPAFLGFDGARLPVIGAYFSVDDTSGALSGSRLFKVRDGSIVRFLDNMGGEGGAERLLEISHNSKAIGRFAKFTNGAGIGVRVSHASSFQGNNADLSGNADANLAVGQGEAAVNSADLSGAGTDAIRISPGPGYVGADSANLDGAGRNAVRLQGTGEVGLASNNAQATAANTTEEVFYVEGTGRINAPGFSGDSTGGDAIFNTDGYVNVQNATLSAPAGNIIRNQRGWVDAHLLAGTGAGTRGVDNTSGMVSVQGGDVSGAASNGIRGLRGGTTNAQGTNARMGASDDPGDIQVLLGAQINANGVTGGLSQTANSVTGDGIIFQN